MFLESRIECCIQDPQAGQNLGRLCLALPSPSIFVSWCLHYPESGWTWEIRLHFPSQDDADGDEKCKGFSEVDDLFSRNEIDGELSGDE